MSMAKSSGSGSRTQRDNLEIESMGTLYKGEWEKKYWSCSRGKERHPYPVGYKATRRHGGHNYSMEISEGLRGPLFSVSCEEGLSSSGNSTTVVWNNMLRKKHVGAKKVHSAIDGSELFGFTNPTVQHLFQDLVAAGEAPQSRKSASETTATEDSSIVQVTPAIRSRKRQGPGLPQESIQLNPRCMEGVVSQGDEKQAEAESTAVQKGLMPSRQAKLHPNASDRVLECRQQELTRDAPSVPGIEITTVEKNNHNIKRHSLESNTVDKSLQLSDIVHEGGRTSRDHLTSNMEKKEMSEEPNWMTETAKRGKEVLQYKRRSQGRVDKEVIKQSAQKAMVSSVGHHGADALSRHRLHTEGKGSRETKALTPCKKQPLQEAATISSPGQFLLPASDAKLEVINLHSATKKWKVGLQAREPPEQQLNSDQLAVCRDTTEGMIEGTPLRETANDPLVVEEAKQPKTTDKQKRMQLTRPNRRSKAKIGEPAIPTAAGGNNSVQAPSNNAMHEKHEGPPGGCPQTPSPEVSKAQLGPESCIPCAVGVGDVVEDGVHMLLEACGRTCEHSSPSQSCKMKSSEPMVTPDNAKLTECAASTTGLHVKDPDIPVRNASPLADAEDFAATGDLVGKPGEDDNFRVAQAGILARTYERSQSGTDVESEETKPALEIDDGDQALSTGKVKKDGESSSVGNRIQDGSSNAASFLQRKDDANVKETTATLDSIGVGHAIGVAKDQRAPCRSAEDFLGVETRDDRDCKFLEDPQPSGTSREAGQGTTTSEGSFKFSSVCPIPSSPTAVKSPNPVVVVSECGKEDASNDEHIMDVTDGRLMESGVRTVLPLSYEVDLDAETDQENESLSQGVKSPAATCPKPEEATETSQALLNSEDSMGNSEFSMGTNVTNNMLELLFPQAVPLLDAGLMKKRKRYSDNHPSADAAIPKTTAEEVCVRKHNDSAATDVILDSKNMLSMDLLLSQAPPCVEQCKPQSTRQSEHTEASWDAAPQDLIQKVESDPNSCAGEKQSCQLQQEGHHSQDSRELQLEITCAEPSTSSERPERHEVTTLQPAAAQTCRNEEEGSRAAVEPHNIVPLKDSVEDKDGHMSRRLIGSTVEGSKTEEQESKQQSTERVKEIERACMCGSPEAPMLEGIGLGTASNKETDSIEVEATEEKALLTPEKAVRKAANDEEFGVPAAGLDHEGLLPSVLGASDILAPVGAFQHPTPVRAVILNVLGTTIHLCVSCGFLEDHKRLLFVHKLDIQDFGNVAASLLGVVETELCHDGDTTPSALFAVEESAICFTPDGQELIMLDCFQLPESSLGESRQFGRKVYSPVKTISTPPQKNGRPAIANGFPKDGGHEAEGVHKVKVVSFKEGTKVRATLRCKQKMRCLVVPEPNTLISAGDKGCIHCWKMDTSWRKCEESFTLPSASYQGEPFDSVSQLLVVPGLPHLIFGCHHSGSFVIWDYVKGTLLSASQTPDYCVHRAQLLELPHDVEQSRSKPGSPTSCLVKNPSTTLGFTAKNLLGEVKQEGLSEIPTIHLLVMASPREEDFNFYLEESDTLGFEEACTAGDPEVSKRGGASLPGSCRMGIMRDNHVAIGIPLASKASAATTLGSYGVMGTTEGEIYLWEIVTGEKVAVFPELQGSPITCIAAHPVGSVLAAAGIENLVVVYAKEGS